MGILLGLLYFLGPGVVGAGMLTYSGRCRGKNGKAVFRLGGWGLLLTYLRFLPIFLLGPLNWLLMLTPSAICFVLAFNALVKEMRAQKNGEFTEAA